MGVLLALSTRGNCCPLSERQGLGDDALADLHDLAPYQQERIKIDGMYKLAENKKVVDEYKDILIMVSETGEVNPSELAKLSRLRTLSIRLNIPNNLFDTLDELLLKDMQIIEVEEPDYIRETRAICEGFFLKTGELRGHVSPEDLIKLLKAKQRSMATRDPAFESLLLDTVRAGDEHARDTNDLTIMEGMSYVLTFFDRYDSAATTISTWPSWSGRRSGRTPSAALRATWTSSTRSGPASSTNCSSPTSATTVT